MVKIFEFWWMLWKISILVHIPVNIDFGLKLLKMLSFSQNLEKLTLGQIIENANFGSIISNSGHIFGKCYPMGQYYGKCWFWIKTAENAYFGLKSSRISILSKNYENVDFGSILWKILILIWNCEKMSILGRYSRNPELGSKCWKMLFLGLNCGKGRFWVTIVRILILGQNFGK